jgi:hypothetical protein
MLMISLIGKITIKKPENSQIKLSKISDMTLNKAMIHLSLTRDIRDTKINRSPSDMGSLQSNWLNKN